jgi:uncharacterized membrane protein YebE (DUF533 family)
MSEEGISDSRFFMWRAVVAMAHADKVIEPEEKEFIENYINRLPFSEKQRETLRRDLEKQRDVAQMFELVTEPEDQSEFFMFARMLVWSDGDYDAQEKKILEYLESTQMRSLNHDRLEEMVRMSREDAILQRISENKELEKDASGMLGIKAIFRNIYKQD